MNPIVILIAIALMALMVAFGRNPIEELREKRAAQLAGKDPLIVAIEEHNKSHSGLQNIFSGSAGAPTNGFGAGGGARYGGYGAAGNGFQNSYPPPQYPSYMLRTGQANPYQPYRQQSPYQQLPPQTTPQQQGYYPPPPVQPAQQPRSDAGGLVIPMLSPVRAPLYLRSGQKVAFLNTSVYTYNADGKMVPMPDGKYAMFDGKVTLVVKGGRKVIY